MNKIKRVSLFFRIIFQIILCCLPVFLIIFWINAPETITLMQGAIKLNAIPVIYNNLELSANEVLHQLTTYEKILGLSISTIPMLIHMYILYSLIKIFSLFEQGVIFSFNNVRYIRNIGYALLIEQIINPIYEFTMGLLLTWRNPPGHRFAAISFDQTNFGVLLTALLVILISWIMAEAWKMTEEQRLTI